jgi:flavin reductase (DIM6/NTAB) family NADH-FMN oxidoreductase RutF
MTAVARDDFRAVMGSFGAGVTVITAIDAAGAPQALTATAFSALSAEPPMCLVCVSRGARSHGALLARRAFAVNILRASQAELSNRFASRRPDKFDGVDWQPGARTGCPLLADVLATAECEVTEVVAGGDHDIFLGRLVSARATDGAPLIYFRGGYAALRASSPSEG